MSSVTRRIRRQAAHQRPSGFRATVWDEAPYLVTDEAKELRESAIRTARRSGMSLAMARYALGAAEREAATLRTGRATGMSMLHQAAVFRTALTEEQRAAVRIFHTEAVEWVMRRVRSGMSQTAALHALRETLIRELT